jgi:hypothetical protein
MTAISPIFRRTPGEAAACCHFRRVLEPSRAGKAGTRTAAACLSLHEFALRETVHLVHQGVLERDDDAAR